MAENKFTREFVATVSDPKVASRMIGTAARSGQRAMVEAGYATVAGVRAGLKTGEIADLFGRSSSAITLYRRAGLYLMAGGDPESQAWRVLTAKSKANDKRVAEAIESDGATADGIDKVLWTHFRPDGKPVVETPRAATPATGEVPPLDEIATLLARVKVLSDGLDAEQWSTVETAIGVLVTRKVKALAKVEAAAAKVA